MPTEIGQFVACLVPQNDQMNQCVDEEGSVSVRSRVVNAICAGGCRQGRRLCESVRG